MDMVSVLPFWRSMCRSYSRDFVLSISRIGCLDDFWCRCHIHCGGRISSAIVNCPADQSKGILRYSGSG